MQHRGGWSFVTFRSEKEAATDRMQFETAASLRDREEAIEQAMGEVCKLDADAVQENCSLIIEAARNDLHKR